MNKLASNPAFLQRVKTFKEINMNFLATEASAFHLDMPRCLPALLSTRPDSAAIDEVVHKLVSLCVTLNEYPHVRYNQNSVLGARLATLVQEALNVRGLGRVGCDMDGRLFKQESMTERLTPLTHRLSSPPTDGLTDHGRSSWRGRRTGGTTGSRATRKGTAPRCCSWTGRRTP